MPAIPKEAVVLQALRDLQGFSRLVAAGSNDLQRHGKNRAFRASLYQPGPALLPGSASLYFHARSVHATSGACSLEAQAKKLEVSPLGGGANDIADGVLQTTRASTTLFDRTFLEGFVRPGMGLANWVSRTNYPACGIVQTGPAEMSLYVQRHYGQHTAHLGAA